MGSWGVKATDSDYGLDMLDDNVIGYLMKSNFQFSIKEIKDILKERIISEIRYANRGSPDDWIEIYIDSNFPQKYDYAVLLLAECLVDYFSNSELVLSIYDPCKGFLERKVTEFVYTVDDLESLLNELKALLDPERETYQAWKDSQHFLQWQEHIKSLCSVLENQIAVFRHG